jgi:hypothetical protein
MDVSGTYLSNVVAVVGEMLVDRDGSRAGADEHDVRGS